MRMLDRLTGRVTMYRLVTLSLVAVAVAALLLSLVGVLPFAPLALLASLAAALFGTLGANAVVGLLFRSRPHAESSLITALILFFLYFPTTAGTELASIALAGVLATASKYALAWRGRHVFNAAAAGVALVAVLQLNSTVWWVASAPLLPFVLVGAFLVLYRTRRVLMGVVFVGVAGAILAVQLTASGQSALTGLTSYPLLFFAGFMLSEPLTLPPRRWQQLALAAVVGALFTVNWTFPPVFLSFEAALLIGNLAAFLLGQRRGVRMSYLGSRRLTPSAWEFRFAPQAPLSFRPGQYLELALPHTRQDPRGSRRAFSISSSPSAETLTLAMRVPEEPSSFKRALRDLAPGARVHATSVGGDFLLPSDRTRPVLLVASGIGVTPFLSQLAHDSHDRDIVLVYSVPSAEELAFADELADARVLLVAPDAPPALPAAWRYVGAGPVSPELLREHVPDVGARVAYVSGSPDSVRRSTSALRRAGARRIRTDYFTGY